MISLNIRKLTGRLALLLFVVVLAGAPLLWDTVIFQNAPESWKYAQETYQGGSKWVKETALTPTLLWGYCISTLALLIRLLVIACRNLMTPCDGPCCR